MRLEIARLFDRRIGAGSTLVLADSSRKEG